MELVILCYGYFVFIIIYFCYFLFFGKLGKYIVKWFEFVVDISNLFFDGN